MEYLKIWTNFREAMTPLSDAEKGRLFDAMLSYAETGEIPNLNGNERFVFPSAKQSIDRMAARDEQLRLNGSKGGRPKKAKTTEHNQQKPNETKQNQSEPDESLNIIKENKIYKQQHRAREETAVGEVEVDPLILKIQQELNGLTDTHYQALNDYREELSDEVVSYAIDSAVANGIRNWAYVAAILRDYSRNGVKTVGAAKAQDEKHREKKGSQPRLLRAQDYKQREYHEDEMKKILGVDDLFISDEEYLKRYGKPRTA